MCTTFALLSMITGMAICQPPAPPPDPPSTVIQENFEITIRPGETIRVKTLRIDRDGKMDVEIDPRDKSYLLNAPFKTIWEERSGQPFPEQQIKWDQKPEPKQVQTQRVALPAVPPVASPSPPIIRLRVPMNLIGVRTLPPPEYDHHYEGHLIIRVMDTHAALLDACSSPTVRVPFATLACARRLNNGDRCLVHILREDLLRAYDNKGWTREILLRHEIGHCNGWPGTHPDARPLPATP